MGAWIEIKNANLKINRWSTSHPTMGAWIEIVIWCPFDTKESVAPHDGCVD